MSKVSSAELCGQNKYISISSTREIASAEAIPRAVAEPIAFPNPCCWFSRKFCGGSGFLGPCHSEPSLGTAVPGDGRAVWHMPLQLPLLFFAFFSN